MKPISSFGLGLMFFARFVSKQVMEYRTYGLFSLRNYLAQTSAKISPPKHKNPGYVHDSLFLSLTRGSSRIYSYGEAEFQGNASPSNSLLRFCDYNFNPVIQQIGIKLPVSLIIGCGFAAVQITAVEHSVQE